MSAWQEILKLAEQHGYMAHNIGRIADRYLAIRAVWRRHDNQGKPMQRGQGHEHK